LSSASEIIFPLFIFFYPVIIATIFTFENKLYLPLDGYIAGSGGGAVKLI
jgi:hypothetical protein